MIVIGGFKFSVDVNDHSSKNCDRIENLWSGHYCRDVKVEQRFSLFSSEAYTTLIAD